jgi:hypothetical protein
MVQFYVKHDAIGYMWEWRYSSTIVKISNKWRPVVSFTSGERTRCTLWKGVEWAIVPGWTSNPGC